MEYKLSPDMAEKFWYVGGNPEAEVEDSTRCYRWTLPFGTMRRRFIAAMLGQYGDYEYTLEVKPEQEAMYAMALLSLGSFSDANAGALYFPKPGWKVSYA